MKAKLFIGGSQHGKFHNASAPFVTFPLDEFHYDQYELMRFADLDGAPSVWLYVLAGTVDPLAQMVELIRDPR